MGTIDEHWCTLCKKKLDKAKDKYVDFELIHKGAAPVIKQWKKPKGLICMECIEKDPKLKECIDAILKAGNPVFIADVSCHSIAVCGTYQPTSKPHVNCRHIAVIGDTVYCKRSHPGNVRLAVEKAERQRADQITMVRLLKRVMRNLPPTTRDVATNIFTDTLATRWIPPSQVINDVPRATEETDAIIAKKSG